MPWCVWVSCSEMTHEKCVSISKTKPKELQKTSLIQQWKTIVRPVVRNSDKLWTKNDSFNENSKQFKRYCQSRSKQRIVQNSPNSSPIREKQNRAKRINTSRIRIIIYSANQLIKRTSEEKYSSIATKQSLVHAV